MGPSIGADGPTSGQVIEPITEAEARATAVIDQIVPVAMDQHRRLVADTWRPYRYNSMAD